LFDGGVEDQELAERSLEGREAHHREHGEAEQHGHHRHAPAAAGQLVEPAGTGAADQPPGGDDQQAAHHHLVAEVHGGAGIADGAAQAKTEQDVAGLGDSRDKDQPGQAPDRQQGEDFAQQQYDGAGPGQLGGCE